MTQMRWLLRASKWARNPPSMGRVKLTIGVILICLALFGLEKVFGTPDWVPEVQRGGKLDR